MIDYNLKDIETVVKYPSTSLYPVREFNKRLHKKIHNTTDVGANVMEKDWDNLIILDTARYDYFNSIDDLHGKLSSMTSVGSSSREFTEKTFCGKSLYDTIYITGNHTYKLIDNVFFHSVPVFKGRTTTKRTIENYREITKELLDSTLKLSKKYPHKRIITHLMQPHVPYMSSRAADLRQKIAREHNLIFATKNNWRVSDPVRELPNLMAARRYGLINNSTLIELYIEDLRNIVRRIESVVGRLNGKSIITADHGELFGTRVSPLYPKYWGHFNYAVCEELRQVPWLEIDSDTRKEIQSDPPLEDNSDEEIPTERLKTLGYA